MPPSQLLNARPIQRASLASSVYQSVLEAILSGALPAGSELSEVTLAAELGVSRTPVHEAIARLATDGLVDNQTSNRARVVQFSRPQVVEIYEMRLLLEPASAERAAERLDAGQLTALRESADAIAASTGSRNWAARAIEFDIRFHDALAAACGNERLHAEIVKYRRLVRAFCRAVGTADNLKKAFREHLSILQALEARDGEGARRAMAAHIRARLQAVLHELGD